MISRGLCLWDENKEVLLCSALNLAVDALLLSLDEPLSRGGLAHWADELDVAGVELYGSEADALGVIPFAFVFAHQVLLIVVLLAADAIAIRLVFVAAKCLALEARSRVCRLFR